MVKKLCSLQNYNRMAVVEEPLLSKIRFIKKPMANYQSKFCISYWHIEIQRSAGQGVYQLTCCHKRCVGNERLFVTK